MTDEIPTAGGNAMISEDEIDALPEDDEAAFVQYEGIIRGAVRSANLDPNYESLDVEMEYVARILAFVDNRALPWEIPRNPPYDDSSFSTWYRGFIRSVDFHKASAQLRVAARRRRNVTSIALSINFKTRIGGHLTAIHKIVSDANVSEDQRDAIYQRINNLQEEVNLDRTRTEAVIALWLDITSAISKGAKNLDPAIDRLERIMGVFSKARDENEQQAFAAPQERMRIAASTTPPRPEPGLPREDTDEIP